MFPCGLFLVFIVTSPVLSSVVLKERDEICSNELSPAGLTNRFKRQATSLQTIPQGGKCVLPPYPEHGSYTVVGNANALPGETYPGVLLNVTCNSGFGFVNERSSLYCFDGFWSNAMPKCVRFCHLKQHDSVEYHCLIDGAMEGTRKCGSQEPSGTVVKPKCREPIYYYTGILNFMKCTDGEWNYVAKCKPECGTITPDGIQLVIGGKSAKRGELPWHVGIYTKTTTPYMQICGGSLISTTTVISAAHCFWSDEYKLLPATDFAVAAGKIYRPWNNPNDSDAQKSDVADIKVSPYFQGGTTSFQNDIAIVIVSTPFIYKLFIRPVCIDFDVIFDKLQLYDTNLGKVAGWGLVAKNGNASQVLKVVELPYVNVHECYALSPPTFRQFITGDKICAGYTNGTTLCQGDSGGGLAFPVTERGTPHYYLRGVVSTAPRNEDLCNANTLTTFTHITKHEHFIQEHNPFSSVTSSQEGKCVLPPYPKNGYYTMDDNVNALPGQKYHGAVLNITCNPGFGLENMSQNLYCFNGFWSAEMPSCIRFCRLNKHDSIEYRCNINGTRDTRECGLQVPSGEIVKPICKGFNQYSSSVLNNMRCIDGTWDYIATCKADCGRFSSQGISLREIGAKKARRGELPWHAMIYTKTITPFQQICGGSLISTTVVISVAHCFWRDGTKLQPAANYAVAVGKLYRSWDAHGDPDAQKSDVADIKVPLRFQGAAANFQDDIAVVIVETPFEYKPSVSPICISFDINFERQQLSSTNLGKIASWGPRTEKGTIPEMLKVIEIQYFYKQECIILTPINVRDLITSDKMCAGLNNGTSVCMGDSGNGLAFLSTEQGIERYYLRGVASTSPYNEDFCVVNTPVFFTQITKHEQFIKDSI